MRYGYAGLVEWSTNYSVWKWVRRLGHVHCAHVHASMHCISGAMMQSIYVRPVNAAFGHFAVV